ncbi:MAG: hypothetical protein NVSMB57_04420 [Actinomycetota bacterium]
MSSTIKPAKKTKTRLSALDLTRLRYLAERLSATNATRLFSVRVDMTVRARTVTFEEGRTSWEGLPADEGNRWLIAQLRFDPLSSQWTLYVPGRSRWQRLRGVPPARFLEPLIREIERRPHATPWPH